MSKIALCVRRQDFLDFINNLDGSDDNKTGTPHECTILVGDAINKFDQLPIQLISRDECETNEDFLQIIPYVTVVQKDKGIISFKHVASNGKDRSQYPYSIGFGSHIESYVENSLVYSYVNSLVHELKEKLGIEFTNEEIAGFIEHQSKFITLIYNDEPGTSNAVHLGVSCICSIEEEDVLKVDTNSVSDIKHHSATELLDPSTFKDGALGPWSKIVAKLLIHTYNFQ
jgi:predicted NUDIX family phosphoesterase